MPKKRWPRRSAAPPDAVRSVRRAAGLALLLLAAAALVSAGIVFRGLVTELALSSARDAVVTSVNAIVKEIMAGEAFDSSALVSLEKDVSGAVTAVTTNVAAVNALASEILALAVERTSENVISVRIPIGNLLGSTLLLGKGPEIPVDVVMLSSSVAGFRSELASAGINQTLHQILLELDVEVSLLMPWRTVSASVDTEILVSETVIVGDVPQTYVNWEN